MPNTLFENCHSGPDFSQWHIDRTMFEYVIRHRSFQRAKEVPTRCNWARLRDQELGVPQLERPMGGKMGA
ncbi:hypothetical protein PG985_013033 [Apiospora marii]|uniref:Uncharacterized protein n=1 Tax=Apiospora marii TaxID=335849 RepID=A0ABR1RBG0_9PEZI